MSNQDATDTALSACYLTFVTDLATVLDLAAGTAAATQSTVYTTDLAGLLDLDAGLTAILTGETTAIADPPGTVAALCAPHDLAEAMTGQPEPAHGLCVLDATRRFTLRTRRSYGQLRSALQVDCDLICCRTDARRLLARVVALAQARARFGRTSAVRYTNDESRRIASNLASARVLAIDRGLGGDLVTAVTSALNHALMLDRVWRDATAPAYNPIDGRALDAARTTAHDLAEALSEAITQARVEANVHARDLNIDLLVEGDNGSNNGLETLLERVADLGDNFIGADLRAAQIEDVADITGILWSPATSWPRGWVDRIRAMSVEIRPGIFLIAGDAGKRNVTRVHT